MILGLEDLRNGTKHYKEYAQLIFLFQFLMLQISQVEQNFTVTKTCLTYDGALMF